MRHAGLLALAIVLSSQLASAAPPSQPASGPFASGPLARAREAIDRGQYEDADKFVQDALRSPPLKVRAACLRAELLAARGKLDEAIRVLESEKNASGPDARRVWLLLGEYLIRAGKRADADEPLHRVVEAYNDGSVTDRDAAGLAEVGRAAFLLRSPKDANQAFKESERADPKRVETKLWAAELFLDKYDPGHAAEELREALDLDPKNADALVAKARVTLEQTLDFDEAEALVAKALAENPKHAGAFAVRAGIALRDMDTARAMKIVDEGLAARPFDLELLSLRAAARFLDDDPAGFAAAKREVFAKNPQYSTFYEIVGEYAEWEHRYDDIVAMMKEATQVDADDAKAWANLGLTQLRSGDETAGLENLRKAWRKDKFNVRVFNTLNLYERDIPNQYELAADGIFKIRYVKDERPIMERYVPRLIGEAWASMKARYGFVPSTPVQIELYGSRESFSVRTSGLPNVGIQGVCFGRTVAAISPTAEPFNWGNVVWHELGHVFAIQLSKNHVPRWFTEGLSEYETIARRPEWARELDPELYRAITTGKLPGAVDMNRAFTHAEGPDDMTVAYYASSQMLVWTVERFGMPRVVRALDLWGRGKKTPAVIQEAFGVTPTEYDAGYRSWQLARLSRYANQYLFSRKAKELGAAQKAVNDAPQDASARVDLALALAHERKLDEAKSAVAGALRLDPKHADAHFVAARIAFGEKDFDAARKHLESMREGGADGYVVQSMLADVAEAKKDLPRIRHHLEAAYRFDPSKSDPLRGLLEIAEHDKRADDALDILRKLAALEQHDQKVWRTLLERLVERKAWDEARRVGESAIFVDVTGGRTHLFYARALAAQNAHEKAIFEAESALLCPLKPADEAAAHELLATELAAVGRAAEAKDHAAKAKASRETPATNP